MKFTNYLKPVLEDVPDEIDELASMLQAAKKDMNTMIYKKFHKIMMSKDINKIKNVINKIKDMNMVESKLTTPEELLRNAGLKIKLVAPTKFGTQIDFMKKYKKEEIEKSLQGFTLKFDGKSVFVID